MPNRPEWTEYWTLTEAAECLPYHQTFEVLVGYDEGSNQGDQLYSQLWQWHGEAAEETRTPHGGDCSNGTVETPDGRLQKGSDQLASHWSRLTDIQQRALHESYLAEQQPESSKPG